MITDGKKAFEAWAPPHSVWSPWAKPVLFASSGAPMDLTMEPTPDRDVPLAAIPPSDERGAIVVDLKGADSVWYGWKLSKMGYQPVPLFNAVSDYLAIVNVDLIRRRLLGWSDDLEPLSLPADAPPAFLIDSARRGHRADAFPGRFDNRSVLFPQDFPSCEFMIRKGIRKVFVLRESDLSIDSDLAEILYEWKRGGLLLSGKVINGVDTWQPIFPRRPLLAGMLWYRILVLLGLRRHSAGGFGAIVPEPSASGSGGG